MTVFTGTVYTDTFIGTDYAADAFHFDPTTLDASDVFDGGLTTAGAEYDQVVLAAGTYAAADFAGMSGIEMIVLDGPVTLKVDAAWSYIDTVRLVGAAGQIDASDYLLVP